VASEVYLTVCSLIDLDNWSTKLRFCTRAISICFLFLTMTTAAVPILMILAVLKWHKNVHQNLRFEEHSYALAMVMMMTMMSKVQLCWFLNSVLHLIQLCPKQPLTKLQFTALQCHFVSYMRCCCTVVQMCNQFHCSALGCVLHWALSRTPIVLMLKGDCTIWSFSTALRCKHWLLGFHKHLCC